MPRSNTSPRVATFKASARLSAVRALRAPTSSSCPQIQPQPFPFVHPLIPAAVSALTMTPELFASAPEAETFELLSATQTNAAPPRNALAVVSTRVGKAGHFDIDRDLENWQSIGDGFRHQQRAF